MQVLANGMKYVSENRVIQARKRQKRFEFFGTLIDLNNK